MPHPLEQDLDYVLSETRELWENVRGQKIFLTGGTGFVGTWLVESFVWANHHLRLDAQMVLLSRHPDAFRNKAPEAGADPCISFITGSVTDFPFPSLNFRYIIHGATDQSAPPSSEEPTGTFDRDVAGTRRVLEFARTAGTARLLFTSSGAVYGRQPSEISHVSEEYAGAPFTTDLQSAYGQAKRVSEFLCVMHGQQYGFDPIIARLFAFAGPRLPLNLNFAIGNFVRDVLSGGPVRIGGDGSPMRSYLYAADLAIWLWTLLFKGKSARPYNVGSGVEISIKDLAQAVVDTCAPGMPIAVAQDVVPGKPVARYVPCVDRVRTELGLQAKVPLEEAIRKMYLWNQPRQTT